MFVENGYHIWFRVRKPKHCSASIHTQTDFWGIWEWRSSRKGEQMHMLTGACRSVTGSSWWLELAPEELEASVRLTRPTAAQRHAAISTIMSRNESCWTTALFS